MGVAYSNGLVITSRAAVVIQPRLLEKGEGLERRSLTPHPLQRGVQRRRKSSPRRKMAAEEEEEQIEPKVREAQMMWDILVLFGGMEVMVLHAPDV